METRFLKTVQDLGWQITSATDASCDAKCGAPGCQVKLRLRTGMPIPPRAAQDHGFPTLTSGAHAIKVISDQRKALCLNLEEVEHVAGLEPDHFAKIMSGARNPSIDTFIYLANALGFDVALVPKPLPAITLGVIADTRDQAPARARAIERAEQPRPVRAGRQQPG